MSSLDFTIADAVSSTSAPPIPKARAWADEYLASSSSDPLLDLSQGVPRSAPHPSFLNALSEVSATPEAARYGAILGEPSLRQALAEEIRVQYALNDKVHETGHGDGGLAVAAGGGSVNAADVGITTGCNMAFLVLIMALCPLNTSSVLLPLPTYFNQAMSLSLQSVKPVYIPCDPAHAFKPSLSSARAYLGTHQNDPVKPRMIVLVTPNNPTGTVYSHEEIHDWYFLAKEYKVALILDETYRDFVLGDGNPRGVPHRLFEEPEWRRTAVCVGSFSKGYRIPGHRLGSITAAPGLLQHVATICDCMQICAPRPPQIALAPLLPFLRTDLESSSQQLSHRRHLFTSTVNSIPGWQVISSGGYYAYVSFPIYYLTASSALGLKRKKLGSEDVARLLALKCGVVVLPGAFFMPGLSDEDAWEEIEGGETLREDKWLRFAVANVEDEEVIQLGPRLRRLNKIMGMVE